MTIIETRLDILDSLILAHGKHANIKAGACLLEAVSYIAGEPWSDHPEPVRSRRWNQPTNRKAQNCRPPAQTKHGANKPNASASIPPSSSPNAANHQPPPNRYATPVPSPANASNTPSTTTKKPAYGAAKTATPAPDAHHAAPKAGNPNPSNMAPPAAT